MHLLCVKKVKEISKRYYDRHKNPEEFKIGKCVYTLKESRISKFDTHYVVLYEIINVTSLNNIALRTDK